MFRHTHALAEQHKDNRIIKHISRYENSIFNLCKNKSVIYILLPICVMALMTEEEVRETLWPCWFGGMETILHSGMNRSPL